MHNDQSLIVGQLAYVVADLERGMHHWADTLGVGPFFAMPDVRYDIYEYQGHRYEIRLAIALAYWGDMQIELVQQLDDTPSLYRDTAGRPFSGLHHHGIFSGDIDRDEAILRKRGLKLEQRAISHATDSEVRYYSGSDAGFVELIRISPPASAFFAALQAAANEWNGGPIVFNPGA